MPYKDHLLARHNQNTYQMAQVLITYFYYFTSHLRQYPNHIKNCILQYQIDDVLVLIIEVYVISAPKKTG